MTIDFSLVRNIARILVLLLSVAGAFANLEPCCADERTNYLNYFGVGARALGLSNAYTASCNDFTAPFWNTAAMDFFTTIKIGAMRNAMSLDREMNFVAIVFPTEKYGAFALAWAGFGIKNIEARMSNTLNPDGYFSSNDDTYFLGYSFRLLPYLAIGANAKFFSYGMSISRANGFGIDLATFMIPFEKMRLGFVIQDVGSHLRWRSGIHEKFKQTYRLGGSFELFSNVLISCDAYKMGSEKTNISLATELLTMNILRIRCGIQEQRLTGGLGFTLPIRGFFVNFNYAIANDRFDAGLSDILDLSVVF